MTVNAKALARDILDEGKWKLWWPGRIMHIEKEHFGSYQYKGNIYTIIEKKLNSLVIAVQSNADTFLTELVFLPASSDSVVLTWQGRIITSAQPANRVRRYLTSRKLDQDFDFILEKLKRFYTHDSNIYGLKIIRDIVVDSTLISTSITTTAYPSTTEVYEKIDQLKNFAKAKGALQTGPPMLNISDANGAGYFTRVALPLNMKLKDEGAILYKWMLGGGNILVAEVKGGPYSIESGFKKIEKYLEDHNMVAPAIPYQSLVTDRRLQPDTGKWLTRLYWPVK